MDWILFVIAVLVFIVAGYLMIQDYDKWEQKTEKRPKSMLVFSICMFIALIATTIMMVALYNDNSVLYRAKRIWLLASVWPVAYIDFKTYRIPNGFILLGLIGRILILFFELLYADNSIFDILVPELVCALALFIASVLCNVFAKNSLGFGDIKLFLLMAFMLGSDGTWGAVFLSLIVIFVIAVVLMLTKKKGRKDVLPFGPALVYSTFLSVFLTGM